MFGFRNKTNFLLDNRADSNRLCGQVQTVLGPRPIVGIDHSGSYGPRGLPSHGWTQLVTAKSSSVEKDVVLVNVDIRGKALPLECLQIGYCSGKRGLSVRISPGTSSLHLSLACKREGV
jgi:hypothetical protein